jgi:hypothetical protein
MPFREKILEFSIFREIKLLEYYIMTKSYRSMHLKHNKTVRNNKKYCMDVEFGDINENARLIGYPCHSGANQKFRHNKKTKQLIAKHSGMCLENIGGRILQKKCKASKKTQKWIRKKGMWFSLSNKQNIGPDKTIDHLTLPLSI